MNQHPAQPHERIMHGDPRWRKHGTDDWQCACGAWGSHSWMGFAFHLRDRLAEAEAAAPTPAEPLDMTLMRETMVSLDRILDGPRPRQWPLADQIVAQYNRLAAARPDTPASAEQPGLREALEAIRDSHTPDPEYPSGMGYDDRGGYGDKESVCRVCGTSDEYGVDWPCWTHEQARAALAAADPLCQCGHTRAQHESRYDAPDHCTHRCVPPWMRSDQP